MPLWQRPTVGGPRKGGAAIVAAMLMFAGPASAQGGYKAFGQNIAGLATTLGPVFGQTASGSAPLNDTVEQEQQTFCGS
jgi:hypothetical protein